MFIDSMKHFIYPKDIEIFGLPTFDSIMYDCVLNIYEIHPV